MERGADINAPLSGKHRSALAAAAHLGSSNTIKLLLNKGADVDASLSRKYGSALATAAHKGHWDCVEVFLAAGADTKFDQGPWKSAMEAATAGLTEAQGGTGKCEQEEGCKNINQLLSERCLH